MVDAAFAHRLAITRNRPAEHRTRRRNYITKSELTVTSITELSARKSDKWGSARAKETDNLLPNADSRSQVAMTIGAEMSPAAALVALSLLALTWLALRDMGRKRDRRTRR
jgi:hypothetical protein